MVYQKRFFAAVLRVVLIPIFALPATALADQFPAVVEARQRAVLSAQRAGVLSQLSADVGDLVKKDSEIAVVFHKELLLQMQKQQETRNYLRVLVENLEKLDQKGLTTLEEIAKARADLAVISKEIEIIKTEIGRSKIIAPFSGLVTVREVQQHEWVTPGQPVVEIYNPDKLRIVTDIPADIAFKLKVGESREIVFPDINKSINATLAVFSPQVDVRSNTIKVFWSVEPKDARDIGLKHGMKGALNFGVR